MQLQLMKSLQQLNCLSTTRSDISLAHSTLTPDVVLGRKKKKVVSKVNKYY